MVNKPRHTSENWESKWIVSDLLAGRRAGGLKGTSGSTGSSGFDCFAVGSTRFSTTASTGSRRTRGTLGCPAGFFEAGLFLICGAGSTSSSSSCGSSSASSRPSEERPALRTARVFLGFPLALAFDFPAGFDFAFAFPAAFGFAFSFGFPFPFAPGLVVPCSPASCRISSAALQADGGSTKRCQCVWRSKINKRVPPK